MDARPYRYRIEHRDGDLAPLILRVELDGTAATRRLRLEAVRLARAGATGVVLLIDQDAEPEVVVECRAVGPRPDPGGPTDP